MLYGIDISNWQEGLTIPNAADFAIIKATGGTGFVDPCCDGFVQQCINKGKLWGFYHFAGDGWNPNPEEEALWFYQNCSNYFGHGLPVLDIEDARISDFGNYAQRFVDKIHALTGVYPIIYTSSSNRHKFEGTAIPKTCGLWEAYYPSISHEIVVGMNPFEYEGTCEPWSFVAMWQYSSMGVVNTYDGFIDLDVAFMDEDAWHTYCIGDNTIDGTAEIPSTSTLHSFEDDKVKVTIELK